MGRETPAAAPRQEQHRAFPARHLLGTCCPHLLAPQPGFPTQSWVLGELGVPPSPSSQSASNSQSVLKPWLPAAQRQNLPRLLFVGTTVGNKPMEKQTRSSQRDFLHNLSANQAALRRCRNSGVKPFFHLEGLALLALPARPHLDGSGLSSRVHSQPSSSDSSSIPLCTLALRHLGSASPTGMEQLRAQHEELGASSRACQEIRGRAACEELPFASCLPSDSAKYHQSFIHMLINLFAFKAGAGSLSRRGGGCFTIFQTNRGCAGLAERLARTFWKEVAMPSKWRMG